MNEVKMEEQNEKTPKPSLHKPLLAFLIVSTAFVFAFALFVGFIGLFPAGKEIGLFTNGSDFSVNIHYIEITPARWTFSIWGFIYTWQTIWIIYVLVGLCRKNTEGFPVYTNPEILSPLCYVTYIVNLGCGAAWLVLWDRFIIDWALLLIVILPFTLYICLIVAHRRLYANGSYMMKTGMNKDIWMIRLFIHNGLAFYATWVTIATLLNFTKVLAYKLNVEQSIACTVSLSILAFELILWFVLDVFVFDRFTRYQFSPYIVVNLALVGILVRNYTPGARNSIFTVVLLVLAGIAGVVKVSLMFYRHFTRPLFTDKRKPDVVEAISISNIKNVA